MSALCPGMICFLALLCFLCHVSGQCSLEDCYALKQKGQTCASRLRVCDGNFHFLGPSSDTSLSMRPTQEGAWAMSILDVKSLVSFSHPRPWTKQWQSSFKKDQKCGHRGLAVQGLKGAQHSLQVVVSLLTFKVTIQSMSCCRPQGNHLLLVSLCGQGVLTSPILLAFAEWHQLPCVRPGTVCQRGAAQVFQTQQHGQFCPAAEHV